MHALLVASQFMQSPSGYHLGAVKRIPRYVNGTIGYGICYDMNDNFRLAGYSDSDWGGSQDDQKSTTGWVFAFGSGAIAWCSKKQPITALSSTEAEYISAREAVWLCRLLEDLSERQDFATIILCANRSAISISKNPALHG
ncbi:secreted RxLR effector protein 161-like [Dioscorea cayenensis subsp. rotundata]|uniref:Secreted RxLR effector protein 161-like n=1 Tax=Dioscorea cayennensis subsp. rotundata TaxID=55577 RepID=A0AB40C3P6_DIOCR|nr:secreted RxLR effector protein 161-like [Dioscorea cayenensis subsp. rotundata]